MIKPLNIYEGESEFDWNFEERNTNAVNLHDEELCGYVETFSGCCGYGVWTDVPHTEKNIEKTTKFLLEILQENRATNDGFGCVICTVIYTDQKNDLQKYGWETINVHTNPLTDNTIYTLILK